MSGTPVEINPVHPQVVASSPPPVVQIRPTEPLPRFSVTVAFDMPEGGHIREAVAVGPPLQGVMPKEHELISIIKKELADRRKVLVYIQNSNTTDISPRLSSMMEAEGINVKVLRSGDTESRAKIIDGWVRKGMDVLITNPKKVEVGLDLLDFPSIVFYQVPMSTYTLRQASRRS